MILSTGSLQFVVPFATQNTCVLSFSLKIRKYVSRFDPE